MLPPQTEFEQMFNRYRSSKVATAVNCDSGAVSQLEKELGRIVGGIVHDLKSPLRTIECFSGMIQEDFPGDTKDLSLGSIGHYAGRTGNAIQRTIDQKYGVVASYFILKAVVERLLPQLQLYGATLNHALRESDSINYDAGDYLSRISRAVDTYSRIAGRELGLHVNGGSHFDTDRFHLQRSLGRLSGSVAGLELVYDSTGHLVLFDGCLERTLLNLKTNARAHGKASEVHVATFPTPEGGVYVAVVDNGRGFPEGDLYRWLEPGQSTGGDGTVDGSGLGLAVVDSTLRGMGGHVKMYSRQGEGAAFGLFLPPGRISYFEPCSLDHRSQVGEMYQQLGGPDLTL